MPNPWCSKHNREMIPSKFGGFWCPDCSKEKKESKGLQPAIIDKKYEEILLALREIYKKLLEIDGNFKAFTQIFGVKEEKEDEK